MQLSTASRFQTLADTNGTRHTGYLIDPDSVIKNSALEICATDIRTAEIGIGEIGFSQPAATEVRVAQGCAYKIGMSQICIVKVTHDIWKKNFGEGKVIALVTILGILTGVCGYRKLAAGGMKLDTGVCGEA